MVFGKVFKQEKRIHPEYKTIDVFDYKEVEIVQKDVPVSGMLLDLMSRCLRFNAEERISILYLKNHKFFREDLKDPLSTDLLSAQRKKKYLKINL